MSTKRDRLETKLKSLFANRVEELDLFQQFLNEDGEYDLLNIIGIGGIGKSALLRAFGAHCSSKTVPWLVVDIGGQELPSEIVRFIHDKLANEHGLELPNLKSQLQKYNDIANQLRGDTDIPSELQSLLLFGVTSLNQGSDITVESPLPEQAFNYLAKHLGRAIADFFLNPSPAFTSSLVQDLSALAKSYTLCLIFDRYEAISPYLDSWLCNELFPLLDKNVFVVVSGRRPLSDIWQEWLPVVRSLTLAPLSKGAVEMLVRLRGVSDTSLIEEIANFAGGLPLAASIAADIFRSSSATRIGIDKVGGHLGIVEQLVRKLTEEAPPELKSLLENCAIVRWFNEDTLEQFVGIASDELRSTYDNLSKLSFVQPHPNGLALHDLVWDFLNDEIVKRSRRRYAELHERAVEYYSKLIDESQNKETQSLIVEWVYHLLRADEDKGFLRMREFFDNATDFSQVGFSTALLRTTQGLNLRPENLLWRDYFEGVLWAQRSQDNLKSAELLKELTIRANAEQYPELLARISSSLAMNLWYLAEFEDALKYSQLGIDLSKPRQLIRCENRSIEALGLTLDRLGDFDEAISTQLQLLTQARSSADQMGEAWALNNLGYFYWHSGEWVDAEKHLLRCQSLLVELGNPYGVVYPLCHLGLLYVEVNRLADAERLLVQSLRIAKEEVNTEIHCKTLQNLTDLRRKQARFDDALYYIEEALKISRQLIHPFYTADSLRRKADVLSAMGNRKEAVIVYLEGLSLAKQLKVLYTEMRIIQSLERLRLLGEDIKLDIDIERFRNICESKSYHALLSSYYLDILLHGNSGQINPPSISDSLYLSLSHGLLFNQYFLDRQLKEALGAIVRGSLQGGTRLAIEVLSIVREQWQKGTIDGARLVEQEEVQRQVEQSLYLIGPNVSTLVNSLINDLSSQ